MDAQKRTASRPALTVAVAKPMPRPVLSVPANGAPGRSTLPTSAKRRSWASGEGTWCSIVKQAAPLKLSSSKGIAVAVHDLDLPAEAVAKRGRQAPIDLEGGYVGGPLCQRLGGGSEAGAYLEHSRAQLDTFEGGRNQVLANVALPGLAAAVSVVQAVQGKARGRAAGNPTRAQGQACGGLAKP